MTVKQLIRKLKSVDPKLLVLIDGYEGMYQIPSPVFIHNFKKIGVEPGLMGNYDAIDSDNGIKALVISRSGPY